MRVLNKNFGVDRDLSWHWNEKDLPNTPLGMLRSFALVFVGKALINGQNVKIAAVPLELRTSLIQILKPEYSVPL